ncbi:MAG: transcription-repair coupling factor [Oscillospiraceae bacterium]|nr:transcription-repair coupling factor [Oscillospiraceae bacterium]
MSKLNQYPRLLSSVKLGECIAFGGLSGVHAAHLIAALRQSTKRPVLVICSDEQEAKRLAADVESFSGEQVISLCPREFNFRSVDTASRQWETARLRAFSEITRGAGITVSPIDALMQRTMPKKALVKSCFSIELGKTYDRDALVRRLIDAGYSRTQRVEGCGQFAVRGEILDVFSPSYDLPIRIDFFDTDVDAMGFFDVSSQRRVDDLANAQILPACETIPEAYDGGAQALADALDAMAKTAGRRKNARNLIETLQRDASRLREEGVFPGCDRYIPQIYPMATALDYFSEDAIVFCVESGRVQEAYKNYEWKVSEDIKALLEDGVLSSAQTDFLAKYEDLGAFERKHPCFLLENFISSALNPPPADILSLTAKQLPAYNGNLDTAISDLRHYLNAGYQVYFLTADEQRAQTVRSILEEHELPCVIDYDLLKTPETSAVVITCGTLSAGFEYPSLKLALISENQLIARRRRAANTRTAKKKDPHTRIQSYSDLHPGDLVVHDLHGIGRFSGIEKIKVDAVTRDYIKIEYSGTDVLYVPATQLDMVSKYIGASGEDSPVRLNKLSGTEWQKSKSRAKAAAKDMAKRLIALYAERTRLPGFAFPEDDAWQQQFENAFEYEETDDQLRCAGEIKADMEKPYPMDRLLCGDVGFGKTEVALRAAMKCILAGKQVAMLVPTTVLARQHYLTILRRFSDFPVKSAMLSRFQNAAQSRDILARLKAGTLDFVVGTHKLLSKNMAFKDLGLLIIDEEQRFGVSQKERLRELAKGVDTLTMTATPIPRTLNMALSGVRDMSTLEEAPLDRQPVQTYVLEQDPGILRDAILREVGRGGQVYYMHNRVETIDLCAGRLRAILPDLRIEVAHGQMDENMIGELMRAMSDGEIDVLVCTTIIESGIDIPNVNTIIIEDADRLGLAQLHQIRGRVGRSTRHAYAYLTYKRGKVLSEVSTKRLSALREFAGFGAGFKIAMRDLEIRGAGNILGAEQSGHMMSVGYDMYLQLLEEAVLEERGEAPRKKVETSADLSVSAGIDERYIHDAGERMDIYRRIASIRDDEDASDMLDELIDRFGEPPKAVTNLVDIALLRAAAQALDIFEITQKQNYVLFKFETPDVEKISRICSSRAYRNRLSLNAGASPYLALKLAQGENPLVAAREFIRDFSAVPETKAVPS